MNHIINVRSIVEMQGDIEGALRSCIKTALDYEKLSFLCQVDVEITSDEDIMAVNAQYRGKEAPTDVLSFPMYEFLNGQPLEGLSEEQNLCVFLGDVLISLERATHQALEYGHSINREIGFLAVHSVLHLLGYDHERGDIDKKIMHQKEDEIMEKMQLLR